MQSEGKRKILYTNCPRDKRRLCERWLWVIEKNNDELRIQKGGEGGEWRKRGRKEGRKGKEIEKRKIGRGRENLWGRGVYEMQSP